MGTWEFFGKTIDVVEVPIRFVLVLLIKLGGVEAFIVELANRSGMTMSKASCKVISVSNWADEDITNFKIN